MLLTEVVETSAALAGTRSRLKKAEFIAGLLSKATEPGDTEIVVTYLSGELLQRRTGVGWRTLADAPEPAAEPSLTVEEVDRAFAELAEMGGAGVQARRREPVDALFGRATADEQRFLRRSWARRTPAGRAGRA